MDSNGDTHFDKDDVFSYDERADQEGWLTDEDRVTADGDKLDIRDKSLVDPDEERDDQERSHNTSLAGP